MVKQINRTILFFLLCMPIVACNEKVADDILTDPFILEINTDDLDNIYAVATYVASENLTIYHGQPPILFAVYESGGKQVAMSIMQTVLVSTSLTEGDKIYREMIVSNVFDDDPFAIRDEDGTYKIVGFKSGEDYEIRAHLRYRAGYSTNEDSEIVTSVFVHIP